MHINVLRNRDVKEIRSLIQNFSFRYIHDVKNFSVTASEYGLISLEASENLIKLLKKWQACRPSSVQEDVLSILKSIHEDYKTIELIDLRNICYATPNEITAITRIWSTLVGKLCFNRTIAEVAASKTFLIITNGRIGPALDSNARRVLNIPRIQKSEDYISLLLAISEDIAAFENSNKIQLEDLVPKEWHPIFIGRVYDMIVGPKNNKEVVESPHQIQKPDNISTLSFSFKDAFQILQKNGPANVVSSRGTNYAVEAWIMRNGKHSIRARPEKGYIYIHSDCWGKDITCQNTRAGGIYNGEKNIHKWLKQNQ